MQPEARHQLRLAHEYNQALNSGALLNAKQQLPTGSGISQNENLYYDHILISGPDSMMGHITIPKIHVDLPIYHGTSDQTLARGVGHLEGTSLPVGGKSTHSVLTGHRGLASATLFTNLDQLEVGDTFSINVFGLVFSYQVKDTRMVDPNETASLKTVPGKDLVTLATCTPLGINSQRILVTGERVYSTHQTVSQNDGKDPNPATFPWWLIAITAATLLAIIYVRRSGWRTH